MEAQKKPTTPAEWRAYYYKKEADVLMFAAQAYDKEGETVKAADAWALWTAKKAEIRTAYPN